MSLKPLALHQWKVGDCLANLGNSLEPLHRIFSASHLHLSLGRIESVWSGKIKLKSNDFTELCPSQSITSISFDRQASMC